MNGASKAFSAPGVRVRRQNFQTRGHARRLRYATPAPLTLERVFNLLSYNLEVTSTVSILPR